MNSDEFYDLLERFTELDMDEMAMEDNMAVTLAIMKFMKSVEPIVDKYNPKKRDDEKIFNEFWRLIDGEQE